MNFDDIDDDALYDTQEERALERARHRYMRQLIAHPHPQDPDHPEPLESDDE